MKASKRWPQRWRPWVIARGDEYHREVAAEKAEWDETVDEIRRGSPEGPLSQAQVLGIVNEHSRPQDVVVNAAGTMPGDLLKLWRARDPKGYHVEYGYSTMGYEIPGGLGVKMADPDRNVYVMIGDGSYLMMNSEIVTAIQEGYKLTIVLVENGGFQSIHGLQRSSGTPSFGNELRSRDAQTGRLSGPYLAIDYAKSAESMGAKRLLRRHRRCTPGSAQSGGQGRGDRVIHVKVDPTQSVPSFEGWWDVPVAQVSSQPGVRRGAQRRTAGACETQRFYY